MDEGANRPTVRIDRFFAGPGARADQWYQLVELAESWSRGSADRAAFEAALAELMATEEFHAYPGLKLMTALRDAAAANDAHATASLARRITRALVTRSFRQNAGDWEAHEDGEGVTPAMLLPLSRRADAHRPYFEVLIVTGAPAAHWPALAEEWRRLRRPLDAFVYEPVFVGSFEDAFCGAMLNPDLAAVVIHEGFPFRSRHDAPVLRTLVEATDQQESAEVSALRLAQVLKRVRPELDLYLLIQWACGGDRRESTKRTQCAASSMRWRNCWNCILRSLRGCRIGMTRHSSTI